MNISNNKEEKEYLTFFEKYQSSYNEIQKELTNKHDDGVFGKKFLEDYLKLKRDLFKKRNDIIIQNQKVI